jgi:hypothetical protein
MYVSEASVNKVCRIFKKWKCVKDPFVGRVGRRKIFTTENMKVRKFKLLYFIILIFLYYLFNNVNLIHRY